METRLPDLESLAPAAFGAGAPERALEVGAHEAHIAVPCNLCGATNRVPAERFGERARCGHCRSPLLSGAVASITAARLERVIANSGLPVIVIATSESVPAERRRDEVLDAFARELRGAALVYRIDADREAKALAGLGLSAVPSIAMSLGGVVVSGMSGAPDRAALVDWVLQQTIDALHG